MASWVREVCFVFVLLGLSSGVARAQLVTEFSAGITAGSYPFGITAGPDGNLWFTEEIGNRIGRITPLGVVTQFSITAGAGPAGITAGPDGNLWFTEVGGNRIGRITPLGAVTEFSAGITFNFTVTQPTGLGDLRTVPGGGILPLVSTMNWRPGQTRANNAITPLGPSGDIDVHVDQGTGSVHLIIDVNGYFQ
jgi:DNA-binding beta-propeller fold protein YncE